MRNWLPSLVPGLRPSARPAADYRPACRKAPRLALESLEAREVPAITIQFDYSYDTSGFFNDPGRRAILDQAATDISSHLDANLPALSASGGDTWSATFFNPANGQQVSVANPSIPANTLRIYVGGRPIGGSEAGFGGSGGYSASGSSGWLNTLAARGPGGSLLWGGSLTIDTGTNWWFGSSAGGIGSNQVDFYSVAAHELGHVLGIGTARQWTSLSSGGFFNGAAASTIYGGPVPLSSDGAHFANGLTVGGVPASMDPVLNMGTRVTTTSLDFAALHDLGWTVSNVTGVPSGGPSTSGGNTTFGSPGVAPVPVGDPSLDVGDTGVQLVALTGPTDGSAQIFKTDGSTGLTSAGPRFQPFPGFAGTIRSVVADFDGDGKADFAFGTGSGTSATVRIISGATGTDLVPPTTVLDGFSGGVFLAAGDVDRDGAAELAVSADAGGGNRISVYKVTGGQMKLALDFLAFGDANFRGGSRIAMGDINKDGAADLIVGAGVGGGPRIAVYDGAALLSGQAVKLVPDFFALDQNLRSGVFVTAADFNGDGSADIAYSTGNTGGPRVRIVSGALLLANPGADMATQPALADFFAMNQNDRNGIRITAHDLDGDGRAELIVGSGDKTNATVRVIRFEQMGGPITSLQNPFGDPLTIDGVYVG